VRQRLNNKFWGWKKYLIEPDKGNTRRLDDFYGLTELTAADRVAKVTALLDGQWFLYPNSSVRCLRFCY